MAVDARKDLQRLMRMFADVDACIIRSVYDEEGDVKASMARLWELSQVRSELIAGITLVTQSLIL